MRFACARIRTSLLCITTSRISTLAFSSFRIYARLQQLDKNCAKTAPDVICVGSSFECPSVRLLRYQPLLLIAYRGVFFNLETGRMEPLPIACSRARSARNVKQPAVVLRT